MIKREVIALVGLSGIGKSTLLKDARRKITFQHLQASELIKEEKQRRLNKSIEHDLLREGDIDENQALLITAFMRRASTEGVVVLDGHTLIDTPHGLVEISPSVFSAIGISRFVVLVDDAEKIMLRRLSDTLRTRPLRSLQEIADHQERSVLSAYRAALTLSAPLVIVPLSKQQDISHFLK